MKHEKDRRDRDSAPNDLPEIEYRPDINRGTSCMLIGIASASAFNTALYFKWYPLAFLFAVIVLIAVVWLVRERQRKDRSDYKKYHIINEALDKFEKFDERISTVETNLDMKADRPAKSNIRPGSRQSAQYKVLIGGGEVDSRTANKTAP